MRVLVDAMCAEFGGIRTYAEHLLGAWPAEFPDDDLHVLVRESSALPTASVVTRHPVPVARPATAGRPWSQSVHLPRLTRELRPDVVLATLPSTTVRRVGVPMAVVVYDLRHELRPDQFTAASRVLRRVSYGRGYGLADGFVSISQRTLDDLHRLHPRSSTKPAVVAHLGADHVDAWPEEKTVGPAIAFAHHTNKNLDLVLDGWRRLVEGGDRLPLLVIGLADDRRAEIARRLPAMGLDDVVQLAAYLDEEDFQRRLSSASAVVFPSDFEGFGLPIAEGLRIGVPVLIGPDRASLEVAGGHATVMADWTPVALAAGVRRAVASTAEEREAGRRFADRYTWARTVHDTRALLTALTASAR